MPLTPAPPAGFGQAKVLIWLKNTHFLKLFPKLWRLFFHWCKVYAPTIPTSNPPADHTLLAPLRLVRPQIMPTFPSFPSLLPPAWRFQVPPDAPPPLHLAPGKLRSSSSPLACSPMAVLVNTAYRSAAFSPQWRQLSALGSARREAVVGLQWHNLLGAPKGGGLAAVQGTTMAWEAFWPAPLLSRLPSPLSCLCCLLPSANNPIHVSNDKSCRCRTLLPLFSSIVWMLEVGLPWGTRQIECRMLQSQVFARLRQVTLLPFSPFPTL